MRDLYPTPIGFGGFGEVLARYENQVDLDPQLKDAWGVPVLRFNYRFGDNELKMAKDMCDSIEEMLHAAGAEEIRDQPHPADARLVDPRAGHGADGRRPEDVGDDFVRTDP